MMDPRMSIIDERLKNIDRIITVSGGKGGIGKSSIATMLALTFAKEGKQVGLFDLDFSGPSDHIILGKKEFNFPEEEHGIFPPKVHGIKFMSIADYTKGKPASFRGTDITNAILEILAITRWDELEYLIIDLPPGISDTALDTIRMIKRAEFIIATTPSKLTIQVVKNTITFLQELKIPILGVIENMKFAKSDFVSDEMEKMNVPLLAQIPYEFEYESAIGNLEKLYQTEFAKIMTDVSKKL
ncbi:MAG: P-loop NTPase [Candidatus Cloacimonadota bacterium]|nr:P-loop NTPase [Candidatus Cloacimonadota bacterium]